MANKKLSREDLVISPKHPKWLDTIVADRHCDNDLYKIILFFVIFSPCPKYSTQGGCCKCKLIAGNSLFPYAKYAYLSDEFCLRQ